VPSALLVDLVAMVLELQQGVDEEAARSMAEVMM
jgi:hypothetical protein